MILTVLVLFVFLAVIVWIVVDYIILSRPPKIESANREEQKSVLNEVQKDWSNSERKKRERQAKMIKKIYFFVISLLIGLATLFPPFLLGVYSNRQYRQWGFLFNPPVFIVDNYSKETHVGDIDWSTLFAEYILAIVIGVIISYVWEVVQDKRMRT